MGDVTRLEVVSRNEVNGEVVGPLDVIEVLDEIRAVASRGEVRSVFISYAKVDGSSCTKWAGVSDDCRDRVGLLEVLKFDLLSSRG